MRYHSLLLFFPDVSIHSNCIKTLVLMIPFPRITIKFYHIERMKTWWIVDHEEWESIEEEIE